jgi:hypothetical protein
LVARAVSGARRYNVIDESGNLFQDETLRAVYLRRVSGRLA